MKTILSTFLLLLSIAGFSQNKAKVKEEAIPVGTVLLAKVELITELVKDIPIDCHVTGYVFTMYLKDKKPFKINCVGNELSLEVQGQLKKAKEGDKFTFDKLETACLEKHKTKYIFKVAKSS